LIPKGGRRLAIGELFATTDRLREICGESYREQFNNFATFIESLGPNLSVSRYLESIEGLAASIQIGRLARSSK